MGRRPIEITDEQIQQIRELAQDGVTEGSIAVTVGLSPSRFSERKAMDSRIAEAVERGVATFEKKVTEKLWDIAQDDSNRKAQLTALIWIEKTRFGRYEPKQPSGPDPQDAQATLERFKRLLSQLEERASQHPEPPALPPGETP